MVLDVFRKSVGLKVTLLLAAMTLVATSLVAYVIISQQTKSIEDMALGKSKLAARLGAQAMGRFFEEGIDSGALTVQDVFDTNYEEIRGYDWHGKPKYHTKYDFYTDRVLVPFLDRFLEAPEFTVAIGSDINGYIPSHPSKFMQPVTGDKAKDLVGHRGKTIGRYEVAKKAGANETPVLVQDYLRDTGEVMWDVSSPVYVKGKHWGAFRMIVSRAEVEQQRTSLILTFSVLFGGLILVSSVVMFLMIRASLKPLVQLTAVADDLSLGERLDEPIRVANIDEVGRMAKSLDRLRASLKSAMDRLGE